ncbi:MAG: hypothetical protein L0Y44_09130 [Phycisphaerales bacterium]|nr:hypothetical protein [Phycisphaerales bacterium]
MAPVATRGETECIERTRLHRRLRQYISPNVDLDRMTVSFQANRREPFFNWFKYKEAFSANLVRYVFERFGCDKGVLLDPFAGVGTALLVGRASGWDSIGIELLPVGAYAISARLAVESVNIDTFRKHVRFACEHDWASMADTEYALQHVTITAGAFPQRTERAISGFRSYCAQSIRDPYVRSLFTLAGLAVLESVSFTRKDGQYLRWDSRAKKQRVKSAFDKGKVLEFDQAIRAKLRQMETDLAERQCTTKLFNQPKRPQGLVDLRQGTCLSILSRLDPDSVDLVLTSPPYCNRYDYTRTYALELVYLGLTNTEISELRQSMLSCTVENREKSDLLRSMYARSNRVEDFVRITTAFDGSAALHEVLEILDEEADQGRINNFNIPRMVRNYFFEMSFVLFELARVLKPGGRIVMVNDNVRYAGEEVPVDLILAAIAEEFGLAVEHLWMLARGKGNSSQQMGEHGRSELRKGVYVWRKR